MRKEKPFPGAVSHVFNRGTDKRPIFTDDRDREWFLGCLYLANSTEKIVSAGRAEERNLAYWLSVERGSPLVELGEFSLMGNHFHLTVREVEEGGQARFMRDATISYARYFNARHGRSGRLFEGPYKSKIVDDAAYLAWLVAYIHGNPRELPEFRGVLERGNASEMVEALKGYRWSSLPEFCGEKRLESKILNAEFVQTLAACSVNLGSFIQDKLGLQSKFVNQVCKLGLLG